MKKILKNIILSTLIIFSILSIVTIIYSYTNSKIIAQNLITNSESSKMHQETVTLQENMTIANLMKLNYYNGKLGAINEITNSMIISIIMGILLGTIISLKENSKAKYLLYFIFGNVIYNTIFTIITKAIYAYEGIEIKFLENYCYNFGKTIWSYILIYFIIALIIIIINKIRVRKLNKELKQK